MTVDIVPATYNHAIRLHSRLRRGDVDEIAASSGRRPFMALMNAVAVSDPEMCWTALIDGSPEVMWGVSPLEGAPGFGVVWMLASDEMYRIKKTLFKESIQFVRLMNTKYPTIFNWVDNRNTASMQWLSDLGFRVMDFNPRHGVQRKPFLLFARKPDV